MFYKPWKSTLIFFKGFILTVKYNLAKIIGKVKKHAENESDYWKSVQMSFLLWSGFHFESPQHVNSFCL